MNTIWESSWLALKRRLEYRHSYLQWYYVARPAGEELEGAAEALLIRTPEIGLIYLRVPLQCNHRHEDRPSQTQLLQ